VDMDRDIRTAVDEMVLRDLGSDIVEGERVGEEVTMRYGGVGGSVGTVKPVLSIANRTQQ
jgi:hypothetical protein